MKVSPHLVRRGGVEQLLLTEQVGDDLLAGRRPLAPVTYGRTVPLPNTPAQTARNTPHAATTFQFCRRLTGTRCLSRAAAITGRSGRSRSAP